MKRRVDRVVAGTCAASLALGLSACAAAPGERASSEAPAQAPVVQPAEPAESQSEPVGPAVPDDLIRVHEQAEEPELADEPVWEAPSSTSNPTPTTSDENEVDVYNPSEQEPQLLYGPPSADDVEVFVPSDQPTQLLYGPPPAVDDEPELFVPSDEWVQLLYGPPSMFIPSDEPVAVLYGPPPMFDDDIDKPSDPTDKFEPIEEIQPVLYGPPSMLDEAGNPTMGTQDAEDSDAVENAQKGTFKSFFGSLFGRNAQD